MTLLALLGSVFGMSMSRNLPDHYEIVGNPDPDIYFKTVDPDLYRAAQRIRSQSKLSARELSALKPKLAIRGKDDLSILFYAAWVGNLAAIDQLFSIGDDPLQQDHPGQFGAESFIEIVASSPKSIGTQTLALYLRHGGNPNLRSDAENPSLLERALAARNWGSANALLDRGANPWDPDHDQNTALTLAAEAQFHFFIEDVINRGGFKSASSAQIARLFESLDTTWLRNDRISRSAVYLARRILQVTAYAGDSHSRRMLAWAHGNLSAETLKCITVEEFSERLEDPHRAREVYDALSGSAAARIRQGQSLLPDQLAGLQNHVNARESGTGATLLHEAIASYNLPAIEQLLGLGADPYLRNPMDEYAGSLADVAVTGIVERMPEYLRLYLKHGGDPDYRLDQLGKPLIAMAIQNDEGEIAKTLLEHGADVWAEGLGRGDGAFNALEWAAKNGNLAFIEHSLAKTRFQRASASQTKDLIELIKIFGPRDSAQARRVQKLIGRIATHRQ
jgi:ankyrin repeat protein